VLCDSSDGQLKELIAGVEYDLPVLGVELGLLDLE
jgi:hypothetical protein